MKRCHSFIFKFLNFYIVAIMATVFTLSGCIEEYEADIPSEDSDLLVIEGSICASQLNKFILTRTLPVNSTYGYNTVWGAKVSVRGTDGSEYMTESAGAGYYLCEIGELNPDVEYYLHIEVDGETYESEPQKPLRTEGVAEVAGVQYTPESDIDILITPDAPYDAGKVNYYSWSYDETWEVHADYTTYIRFDTKLMTMVYDPYQFPERGWKNASGSTIMVGSSLNYEGQHIKSLKLYEIARSSERMFYRYSGLIHQRSISKAEYEYELARRQASTEMGGLFTPLPSALPTNIHCLTSDRHVIGFVGCSLNTSEQRFYLNQVDYSIDRPYVRDNRQWLNDCNEQDCLRMVEKEKMYLCEWQDDRMIPGGTLRTAWAYDYQLDVRLRGATAEKPEFWTDEY